MEAERVELKISESGPITTRPSSLRRVKQTPNIINREQDNLEGKMSSSPELGPIRKIMHRPRPQEIS